jgi:recombination DNA repair RAD52 pathway protein
MTLELPDNSPMLSMPWIITFGPMADDDEWEPVVCGPYEREHALGLAEEIVADEELTAVVEPLLPLVEVERIREEIAVARALAEEEADEDQDTDLEFQSEDYEDEDEEDDEGDEDEEYDEDDEDDESEDEDVEYEDDEDEDEDDEEHEHAGPPSPDEIRAGFARIAARLTGG